VPAKPNNVCPLCGGANQCAPAKSGSLETPCWCRDVKFDPALLARVPESQRNESCICPRCAAAAVAAQAD